MTQIINMFTGKRAVEDRNIADYLALQEVKDFEEVFKLLEEQSSYEVLFSKLDWQKYKNMILQDMVESNYKNNQELQNNVVKEFIDTYSERMDMAELRAEFSSDNNK